MHPDLAWVRLFYFAGWLAGWMDGSMEERMDGQKRARARSSLPPPPPPVLLRTPTLNKRHWNLRASAVWRWCDCIRVYTWLHSWFHWANWDVQKGKTWQEEKEGNKSTWHFFRLVGFHLRLIRCHPSLPAWCLLFMILSLQIHVFRSITHHVIEKFDILFKVTLNWKQTDTTSERAKREKTVKYVPAHEDTSCRKKHQ